MRSFRGAIPLPGGARNRSRCCTWLADLGVEGPEVGQTGRLPGGPPGPSGEGGGVDVVVDGHRVTAFVSGKARLNFPRLMPGEKVMLEMSPYDLSEGRIIVETQRNEV